VARTECAEQASVRCIAACQPPALGCWGLRPAAAVHSQRSAIGSPRAAVHEHCEHLSPSVSRRQPVALPGRHVCAHPRDAAASRRRRRRTRHLQVGRQDASVRSITAVLPLPRSMEWCTVSGAPPSLLPWRPLQDYAWTIKITCVRVSPVGNVGKLCKSQQTNTQ